MCALVKAFLKSGVLTGLGDREETLTGTPQGGILSPLLANIALSALDDHFDRQWHQEMGSDGQRRKRRRDGKGNWKIIRYADDFVLMVHGERRHAEALREEVAAVLAPMGLRLAPEKTAVVHLDEGFTFLGFDIRRMRKRGTQKYYACTRPSRKAIQSIKDKVAARTYRSTRHMGLDELIASLNRSLAGWANYFRHGVSKAVFSAVDSHAWHRLMRWIRAKYKQGNHRIGMPELRRRFCDQGWRFACNGVVFTGASSVAVTRYRYRGSTIPTPGPRHQPRADDQRARHVERPLRGDTHGGCGGRAGETHRERSRQGAPVRPSRGVLPFPVASHRRAHRRAHRPVGNAEVQTTAREAFAGMGLAEGCSAASAPPLRPLGPHRTCLRSACGSPVRGDPHAGFCESRGVRFPPATHLVPARPPGLRLSRTAEPSWKSSVHTAEKPISSCVPAGRRAND